MNQSDILRAVRNRIPDSFAPDGAPLYFVPILLASVRFTGDARKRWRFIAPPVVQREA